MQQREAARQFYYKWNGKGNEDEDARSYWIDILLNILGVDHVTDRLDFEKKVIGPDGNTKRIDLYIPETHVLIEQKSLGIALDKPQPGHGGMTPYDQAKMYDNGLPFDEKARWIIILVYFYSGYFRFYAIAIATGSMSPGIRRGDIVIIDKKDKKIKESDIIAYKKVQTIIVHRVIQKIRLKDTYIYYTKGDANNNKDDFVIEEDMILGKVKYKIPFIGYPTILFNKE